jgi:hypothetical protein
MTSLTRLCNRAPVLVVLVCVAAAASVRVAAGPQLPAPYGLFVTTDCEVKTQFSPDTKGTVVQLMLVPPSPGDQPAAASLLFRAEKSAGDEPAPPTKIDVVAIPSVTSNPTVIRGIQLEFTVERAGADPLRLFYPGNPWGNFGFATPGEEVTRASFVLGVSDFQALLVADRVSGRVMNFPFEFVKRHFAAMRVFALAAGIPAPPDKTEKR